MRFGFSTKSSQGVFICLFTELLFKIKTPFVEMAMPLYQLLKIICNWSTSSWRRNHLQHPLLCCTSCLGSFCSIGGCSIGTHIWAPLFQYRFLSRLLCPYRQISLQILLCCKSDRSCEISKSSLNSRVIHYTCDYCLASSICIGIDLAVYIYIYIHFNSRIQSRDISISRLCSRNTSNKNSPPGSYSSKQFPVHTPISRLLYLYRSISLLWWRSIDNPHAHPLLKLQLSWAHNLDNPIIY